MTDPRKIYVGEIGKRIKVNTGMSLAAVTSMTLFVEKPDGSEATEWAATKLGDVNNMWVYYDTVSGDLTTAGVYRLYAKLVYATGRTLYGERTFFNVYAPSEG